MSAVSLPRQRPIAPGAAAMWKTAVLGMPLVIATVFFFIWRSQVNQLANRQLGSFGSGTGVPTG